MSEYRFISFFRALACFWVMVAHCMIWGGWYGLPVPNPKIAVDLFMLVSGFLMVANTESRWSRDPITTWGGATRFWTRRFFRIAPLYYVILFAAIAGSGCFLEGRAELQSFNRQLFPVGGQYDPMLVHYGADNIAMHVSFLFGLVPKYAASTALPDWSLGLEMQFYAAFPLIFFLFRRIGAIPASMFLAGLALVFGTTVLARFHLHFPEPSLLTLKLQYFLAGGLLYYGITGAKWAAFVVVAVVLSGLETKYGGQMFVAPCLVVLMAALGRLELGGAVIKSTVIEFASNTSYSVYLIHGLLIGLFGYAVSRWPALQALAPWQRTGLLAAVVIPVAYSLGYLAYVFIEQPGIALGKRALSWRRLRRQECPDTGA